MQSGQNDERERFIDENLRRVYDETKEEGVPDKFKDLLNQLKAAGIRAVLDEHSDKIGAKIRRAELDKVPYTLILGGKEAESKSVSVRSRAKGDEGTLLFADYLTRLQTEIKTRALPVKKPAPENAG